LFQKFCLLDGAPEAFEPDRRPVALPSPPATVGDIYTSQPHESAVSHVTGAARYVDDQLPRQGMLEMWPVCSPHARANILRRDATAARAMPGVVAVLLAEDIPGENQIGAVRPDEILLADQEISFHGQLVAMVVGTTTEACRLAADAVVVEYEPLAPILTLPEAIAAESFHTAPHCIRRGDVEAQWAAGSPDLEVSGEFSFGGQEHFYLETHAAWAEPGEGGAMFVHSSTQHPTEIQAIVSHVLHVPRHLVVVQSPRMGGGFGGKETQGNTWAALAALAAYHTGCPVRARLNRDQDMILTGKRHPFLARYRAAFTPEGVLRASQAELFANGGWSLDLSTAISDRALFHLDNAYYIPNVDFSSRVAKTNVVSNTAFRGFGGPQGMLVAEEIMDRVARKLGLPPEVVRERNLYHGSGETNTTHYGQEIGDNRLNLIWDTLKASSDFITRREALKVWNSAHQERKRGLAITPVKFGISFTISHLNQAGAHVLIYQDGSVQVNHGGTEMGQGLHTKMQLVAARELGVAPGQVRVMQTRTDQVPNTSPTAASSGSDLNGQAVKAACVTLRSRLAPVAAALLGEEPAAAEQLIFENGHVFHPDRPERALPFGEVALKAYLGRISLAATGFYATPGIQYNQQTGRGRPFYYYAYGAAVSEVEVDGFTGQHRVTRVDILHDCGRSINIGVDRGQVEGGFIQGMGWLTAEELRWDKEGRLLTHSPGTYKIPAFGDTPPDFRVTLLPNAAEDKVIHGSKAVGEPPLMLAISVREAIRDAVAAFASGKVSRVDLPSPATIEAIYFSLQALR
jgi:xanthine dehydrogenase molybdopterin binding subunit